MSNLELQVVLRENGPSGKLMLLLSEGMSFRDDVADNLFSDEPEIELVIAQLEHRPIPRSTEMRGHVTVLVADKRQREVAVLGKGILDSVDDGGNDDGTLLLNTGMLHQPVGPESSPPELWMNLRLAWDIDNIETDRFPSATFSIGPHFGQGYRSGWEWEPNQVNDKKWMLSRLLQTSKWVKGGLLYG